MKQLTDKDSEQANADCSIELVSLKLEDNKNIDWWGIGIDIFRDMHAAKSETDEIKTMIHNLISNFPDSLTSSNSYGYPKFFSLNRNKKLEQIPNIMKT